MVQGQVFLKEVGGGGGGATLFLFNVLKVYHFYIKKLLYPFQNCVKHLKKKLFVQSPCIYKKDHSKLSKNESENIP